ncbi:MAG: UDP-2,4-diacetamido-2,4,6-trideoxy-beta-L-altropyranose hydrolase [Candidatus Lokiarchaeota archaeon]|nr:UDP-2,4-diacetamido-2,4,6-trideoxy-beta-L-altropyranose hydrolase [Candidatus Lokiarchaeota archaeon]
MKVYLVTEGSSIIGLGHVMRILSLSQAFEAKKIIPNMIINSDDSVSQLLIKKKGFLFDWIEEQERFLSMIKNSDMIIIDSYLAPRKIYEEISLITRFPVYIDDNMRFDYPPGIIINTGLHAIDLNYPKNTSNTYLLGPKYSILNSTFWNPPKKVINKHISSILITIGGTDVRNLTPKILAFINEKFPKLYKKVVIGKGFQNIDDIKCHQSDTTELIYFPTPLDMKNLMLTTDLAINAAGQTSHELACVGIPSICITVADNQVLSANKYSEIGINYHAGWYLDKNLLENILKGFIYLSDQIIRKKMSQIGRNTINSTGSKQVIEYLLRRF